MKLRLFSDGGARGNPGPAAYGFVLYDLSGQVVLEHGEYLGETTNNVAEYRGLIAGLQAAIEQGASSVDCFLDSELIVHQLQGRYRIRDGRLQALAAEVLKLMARLPITFTYIPREQNEAADRMVNRAIDAQQIS